MTDKNENSRAKKLAKTVLAAYWERRIDREDLVYEFGLTRDEAQAVWNCFVEAEKAPKYHHFSDESGGEWRVPLHEEDIVEALSGVAKAS